MDLGLAGRVALVCGSTKGLGRAVAKALAHEGARVAINGRHEDSVEHAAQQLSDRKSTRLNSSHLVISYAVFCLKKKKKSCTLAPHSLKELWHQSCLGERCVLIMS